MNEMFKAGFTLAFGLTKEKKIRGGYLKSTERGMVPCGLCGEEILFVSNYPNVLETITGENILQIYKSVEGYISMIGTPKTEGAYCENEYLDVVSYSISDELVDSLEKLDRGLSSEKEISHQKVYKLYGDDKYNLRNAYNKR